MKIIFLPMYLTPKQVNLTDFSVNRFWPCSWIRVDIPVKSSLHMGVKYYRVPMHSIKLQTLKNFQENISLKKWDKNAHT